MPAWGQRLAPLSPLSYNTDPIRIGFGGAGYFPAAVDVVALLGVSTLFVGTARFVHCVAQRRAG